MVPLDLDSLFSSDKVAKIEEEPTQEVATFDPIPRITEDDLKAIKRQKNTESARRSRKRKQETLQSLESKISELQQSNSSLSLKVAVLESERKIWIKREDEFESRVQMLQNQLNQAHQMLLMRSKQL